MKKTLLSAAVGTALLLGASAANAGYFSTTTNFGGNFVIDQFGIDQPGSSPTLPDGDKSFHISLSNLNGAVSLQIPPPGNYGVEALAGFTATIDYDGVPGADLGVTYPTTTSLYSGPISFTNISTSLVEFDFNGTGSTSLKLDGVSQAIPYTTGSFTVNGAGATLFFAQLIGLPAFLVGNVSGSVDVKYQVLQDAMDLVIDETNLVGGSFQGAILSLDNLPAGNPASLPAGNRNGIIDGTFTSNGTIHVPEPASVALLGLGLAGIGAARRRKAA